MTNTPVKIHTPPSGVMSLEQARGNITDAEPLLTSDDPYMKQHALETMASAYEAHGYHEVDPVTRRAFSMAALMHRVMAARVRFAHGIPTLYPNAELALLHLRQCDTCGRPWQALAPSRPPTDSATDSAKADPAASVDSCPDCPRLMFGATPESRAQADLLPAPQPVKPGALIDPDRDDY